MSNPSDITVNDRCQGCIQYKTALKYDKSADKSFKLASYEYSELSHRPRKNSGNKNSVDIKPVENFYYIWINRILNPIYQKI
jgi:hypothetical protein